MRQKPKYRRSYDAAAEDGSRFKWYLHIDFHHGLPGNDRVGRHGSNMEGGAHGPAATFETDHRGPQASVRRCSPRRVCIGSSFRRESPSSGEPDLPDAQGSRPPLRSAQCWLPSWPMIILRFPDIESKSVGHTPALISIRTSPGGGSPGVASCSSKLPWPSVMIACATMLMLNSLHFRTA
jgi:hypothetical protein